MSQLEIYFNTVPVEGIMLREAKFRADKQNRRVLDIFNSRTKSYAAHEVWMIYKISYNERNTPLTSIRRSITTLERVGYLEKVEEKGMGMYGVLVNKWRVR